MLRYVDLREKLAHKATHMDCNRNHIYREYNEKWHD